MGYLKQSKEYRDTHMNNKSTGQSLPATPHNSGQSVTLYVANIPRNISKVCSVWYMMGSLNQCTTSW